jgi:hypothetical protein
VSVNRRWRLSASRSRSAVIGAGELESKGVTFFGDTLDTGPGPSRGSADRTVVLMPRLSRPSSAPQAWTSSCAMGAFRQLVSASDNQRASRADARATLAMDDYERSPSSRHRDARSPGGTTLSSSLTSVLVDGRCLGTRAGPMRPSSLAQMDEQRQHIARRDLRRDASATALASSRTRERGPRRTAPPRLYRSRAVNEQCADPPNHR